MKANSYINFNIDAYRHNINHLKKISNKKMMAIIKANGYGMVDHIVAKILKEEGIDFFGVSSLLEATSLRKSGIDEEILVLGYIDKDDLNIAKGQNISIATISKDYIYSIDKEVLNGLKVHLAIDSGMHRIGLMKDEVKEVLDYLLANKAKVEGIFTHFAKSDDDYDFTLKQFTYFKECLKTLNYDFKYIHTSNTDATIAFIDDVSNYVRCGLGLLGYSSKKTDLKETIELYTTVTNSRLINKGEGVGYGQKYHLEKDEYIITLAIGYADGIIRKNTERYVYINDEYHQIVGNVCMDQLMVKSDKAISVGTKAEIFGPHISLYDMAKDLETIPYEIITSLSDRLERRYLENDKVIMTYDPRFIK